ncbi:MAG: hypothetical protein KF802_03435 [Bdellovibrionaceae bacterium]|nr:hypothetical protein [Pseudobdellovibrionaceae bacterium]MBX3033326.1 hypothetical protein [Pseudobdellovibrionaceae bacterium]
MMDTERTPNQIIAGGMLATAHLFAVLQVHPLWNTAHLVLIALFVFSGFSQAMLRVLACFTLAYFLVAFDEMPGTFFLLTAATALLAFDAAEKNNLRLALFLGYGLAFFHKLNRDFLDPSLSCAGDVLTLAPFLRPWMEVAWLREVLPGAALAVEGFLAFGLLWRVTMPWSFLVAVMFHLAMSPAEIYAIPQILMLLFTGYFLFDAPFWTARRARHFVAWHLALAAPFLWRKIMMSWGAPSPAWFFGWGWSTTYFIFLISNALVILHFAAAAIFTRTPARALSWPEWKRSRRGVALLIVMLLWGLQPYLGLSTAHSMIMHSNLRTEKSSNHLLLGWLPPIFDFQNDAVTWQEYRQMLSHCPSSLVHAMPLFTPLAEFGHVPFGEFEWMPRFEAEKRAAFCRGERLGWRQYLIFRPYDHPGPNRCRK